MGRKKSNQTNKQRKQIFKKDIIEIVHKHGISSETSL